MNRGSPELNLRSPLLGRGAQTFDLDGWTLHELETTSSTNLDAASLPVWNAVRAETQTAGRGRFERAWISDRGGLWLSAVVPAPDPGAVAGLPLIAGLAVCTTLEEMGVKNLRMRWPNDLLADDRKLAGLLVDQFAPDRVVIGIGVNATNDPEACDSKLRNLTTRLADLLPSVPPLGAIAQGMLSRLRPLLFELSGSGLSVMVQRINKLWRQSRQVELALDATVVRGMFNGVDEFGNLLLKNDAGSVAAYNATQVRHLQELT